MKKDNKQNSKHKRPNTNNGITLIALIVTIVIMLILAGVTINVTVDGGLFGKAQSAKNSMEKAQDIEKITKSIIYAKEKDRSGKLTVENLQKELSEAEVHEEEGTIIVKLNGTYYEIGENGKIEELGGAIEKELKIICKDSSGNPLKNSNGNIIPEKIYKIVKSKYSLLPPEIEDYEPLEEKLEGEISESKEITLTYYKIFDDDTELVFTGLNSSGAVTTVESEIVGYMVGDGTSTQGNGLKEKNVKGILKVPSNYKGKKVTEIGPYSFDYVSNVVKVNTGENLELISNNAFYGSSSIKKLILTDKVKEIGSAAFRYCDGITELTMGAIVNTIGNHAFGNLGSLKTVIYNGEIHPSMINWGPNWTEVKLGPNNKKYKVDENNIVYSLEGTTLVLCPKGITGELTIPKGVTTIGDSAFYGCQLSKVVISDEVTGLLRNSFDSMSSLKEIVIGQKVGTITITGQNEGPIGNWSFRNCTNLKTVVLRSSIIAKRNNRSKII